MDDVDRLVRNTRRAQGLPLTIRDDEPLARIFAALAEGLPAKSKKAA